MLQLVATLLRGAYADQAEAVLGAHAIPLLRQQIREAVGALEAARRDLAGAMSGLKGEQRALDGISVQIESLSLSAQKALGDGREDLALKACAQIARLEDERTERAASLQRREVKIQNHRDVVAQGKARLRRLLEGYRLARVDDSLRRAGVSARQGVMSSTGKLAAAEATLARLEERSSIDADFDEALQSLDQTDDAAGELAEAGYGPVTKTDPRDVLARLKAQATANHP